MEFYPTSKRVKVVAYDPDQQIMTVTFVKGNTYEYYEVPLEAYNELLMAESVGKAFQTAIIQKGYEYKKIN